MKQKQNKIIIIIIIIKIIMRTETVPVVGVLGLELMDQNLGKIRGASNIAELQKITLPGTAHILRKASVH